MFIISYSIHLCLSNALNHWAFPLFLLKVWNKTDTLSLIARLRRETGLKVLYQGGERACTDYFASVESERNDFDRIGFFSQPSAREGPIINGKKLESARNTRKNLAFWIIIASKNKIIWLVKQNLIYRNSLGRLSLKSLLRELPLSVVLSMKNY